MIKKLAVDFVLFFFPAIYSILGPLLFLWNAYLASTILGHFFEVGALTISLSVLYGLAMASFVANGLLTIEVNLKIKRLKERGELK